jgi:hypothetical protein
LRVIARRGRIDLGEALVWAAANWARLEELWEELSGG